MDAPLPPLACTLVPLRDVGADTDSLRRTQTHHEFTTKRAFLSQSHCHCQVCGVAVVPIRVPTSSPPPRKYSGQALPRGCLFGLLYTVLQVVDTGA